MRLESGTLFLLSHHLPSPSHLAPPTTLSSWFPQPTPCHRVFLDSSFTIPHLVTAVCTFYLAVHTPLLQCPASHRQLTLLPRTVSYSSYSFCVPLLVLAAMSTTPLLRRKPTSCSASCPRSHNTIWGKTFVAQRSDLRNRPHFRFVFSLAAIEATALAVRAPPSATPLADPCYRRSTICGTAR